MSDSNICSTPTTSKKRELSSPLDLVELKKSKASTNKMILSLEDIQAISEAVKKSLPGVNEQVEEIVNGVLEGLKTKIPKLEEENKMLRMRVHELEPLVGRVEKLESSVDSGEQYSRPVYKRCT